MTDEPLVLTIQIAAKPSTVFRFLSDPALFQQWMGTGATLGASEVTVRYPGGEVARGTIRELVPDRRVVFGWGYEQGAHGLAPDASTVTIELEATDAGGTLVRLTHAGLPSEGAKSEHAKGWNYYLSQLSEKASSPDVAAIVGAYFAAWGETNAAARREHLESCWESGAVFRDSMGEAAGLEGLLHYIERAQRFMPGVRLEGAGKPDLVRGFVRFPWVIRQPDGLPMFRGTNFGRLSAGGKFEFVTGFPDA